MRRMVLLICYCQLVAISTVLAENFHPDRTLLIDYYPRDGSPTNFLFRGNMPAINGSFAYKQLLMSMSAATAKHSITLPTNLTLIDVSYLNSITEEKDLKIEEKFFEANPTLGVFHNRVILGTLIPPPQDHTEILKDLLKEYTHISFDKLPDVMAMLRRFLTESQGPVAVYTHCEAGVDRTGEVSGAYYMRYLNMTFAEALRINYQVESRAIYKMSLNTMQWYCFYLQYEEKFSTVGSCLV